MSLADGARGDLKLTGLHKRYPNGFVAVESLDLVIPQGSFFALLGPSGCGKTTTLRMVAGLEEATKGSIHIGDEDITYAKPYKRPVNTVFQNYALFPHLTIAENVAFGPKRRGAKDPTDQVKEILALTELTEQAAKKPAQLSGGQQQRVALARALINRPDVLLLDEPLGALDLKLRRAMQVELKRIQEEVGLTFVHVTHDQEEAMTMADTVAVMNKGRIEQMGAPYDLYTNPQTTFVANFLGRSNLIKAKVVGREGTGDDAVVKVDMHGTVATIKASKVHTSSDEGWVGIRPEKVLIQPEGQSIDAPGAALSGAVVVDASYIGVSTDYTLRMPWGQEITCFEQNTGRRGGLIPVGTKVDVSWRPEFAFLLDSAQDVEAGLEED
ncbi:ABC transporter ATP-binding protein [Demequina rhizosphaerae]|uniref:ABC transporter ATP-binding protein n=1 Tax=Demequina rhizosphaerae TaxID=1638985 RepID=UPI0007819898|nr:ABC transporter ATP-binding protein [Demequina rhizosphaerae]